MSKSALEAFIETADRHWHNPSSPYRAAADAHRCLERCRKEAADLLGIDPSSLIFTGNATRATNLLLGWVARNHPGATIVTSAIEHPSVLEPARHLFARHCKLPPEANGRIEPGAIRQALESEQPVLLSLMAANNETGALQPWEEAAETASALGVPIHIDAAQWVGKQPLQALSKATFVTASAHKFGGPKGAGFMILDTTRTLPNLAPGGQQENGIMSGTENLPAIAATTAALIDAEQNRQERTSLWIEGRSRMLQRLRNRLPDAFQTVVQGDNCLANTTSLIAPHANATRWILKLDKLGYQISSGSACSTGSENPSHVLQAMGVSTEDARRALRISAWDTTVDDFENLADAMLSVARALGPEVQNDLC